MRNVTRMVLLTVAVGLLSSGLVLAADDSASTNATFVIPSWISLTVVSNGNVAFDDITGPGTYEAVADPQLRVLSTRSWTLTSTILWGSSTVPAGTDESVVERVLVRTPDVTSGTWGIHLINVDYALIVAEDDLALLPEGTYSVIVQYTATTD